MAGGGGGGEVGNFPLACAGIFFAPEALCTNFFSDKYCFFLTMKS